MVVGVCRVVLALPGNNSLKGKRSVVKSVVGRCRQRFHVAAAEIEDLDQHRRATLGFAYVSNDARHARSVLDKVVDFIVETSAAPLLDHEIRVERVGLGITDRSDREAELPEADTDADGLDDVEDFEVADGDDEEG